MKAALALAASLLVLGAVAVLGAGCEVNDYCLNCAVDDGGGDDGGDDDRDGQGGPPDALDGDGGGVPADACINTGPEQCDGNDNDCDGRTDEDTTASPLPQVGAECSTEVGACTVGVYSCVDGELECSGIEATFETCNDIDDDCDGTPDDGDPGGGLPCGTDVGECIAGVTRCAAGGVIDCDGDVGTVGGVAELCNGRDDDCDAEFDEELPTGAPCGATGVGECELGQFECRGGQQVCVGSRGPTFEICDALDQDCDGNPRNGYDLNNDVRNCGGCNEGCDLANASNACSGGDCVIGACDPLFHDVDTLDSTGCEYGPCEFQGPQEACNLADDDCDRRIDEGVVRPNICDPDGACAGTVATCTAAGWDCRYGPNVSTDPAGDIVPESECDDIDNDCDGRIDEGHPQKGQACNDGLDGVCRSSGTLECNDADQSGPVVCEFDVVGIPSSAERCDGLDNDCDNKTDEGAATGNLLGQSWVSIGNGREIMAFEASRPDARAGNAGVSDDFACSRTGVQPWVNVTQPEAAAACASIGARLCSEVEWHRACSVVAGQSYPIVEPSANNGKIFIEAENYFAVTTVADPDEANLVRTWVPDATPGFSGIMALRASPYAGGGQFNEIGEAVAESPRLDYPINFTTGGTHRVWLKLRGLEEDDGNTGNDWIHVGIAASTATAPTQTLIDTRGTRNSYAWFRSGTIDVGTCSAGAPCVRTLSLWMADPGMKVDAIVVTRSNSTTAPTDTTGDGGRWAFATTPDTYQAGVCNGDDFDTTPGGADQDAVIDTGTRASCNANWGAAATAKAFDMSGNVKEWTQDRLPGANPIRGGASNNPGDGLACGLGFTLADDDFFFNNVGFRCCR